MPGGQSFCIKSLMEKKFLDSVQRQGEGKCWGTGASEDSMGWGGVAATQIVLCPKAAPWAAHPSPGRGRSCNRTSSSNAKSGPISNPCKMHEGSGEMTWKPLLRAPALLMSCGLFPRPPLTHASVALPTHPPLWYPVTKQDLLSP